MAKGFIAVWMGSICCERGKGVDEVVEATCCEVADGMATCCEVADGMATFGGTLPPRAMYSCIAFCDKNGHTLALSS